MSEAWKILIVDDDEDVHQITTLSLARLRWKDRRLRFSHAKSAKEAREVVAAAANDPFDLALVDLAMEETLSGIALCEEIRAIAPRTRLVLRTGEISDEFRASVAGLADHILAKTEASADRMRTIVCACLDAVSDAPASP